MTIRKELEARLPSPADLVNLLGEPSSPNHLPPVPSRGYSQDMTCSIKEECGKTGNGKIQLLVIPDQMGRVVCPHINGDMGTCKLVSFGTAPCSYYRMVRDLAFPFPG